MPLSTSPVVRRALLVGAVTAVLAMRVPFLAPALEDLDSANFDLGVHDFNPARYRPHPPGYAVYIAVAKLTHTFVHEHGPALSLASALASALAIVPLFLLVRRLVGTAAAVLASLLLITAPVLWINSVRPLSDMTGFAIVLTTQALLVAACYPTVDETPRGRRLWYAGAAMAGLAIGTRPQAVMLVGPVLALGLLVRRRDRRGAIAACSAALLSWMVPTVQESGGVAAFWGSQVRIYTEAAAFEPLLADVSAARARTSLSETLLEPWGAPWLGAVVLAAAAAGAVALGRHHRQSGLLLLVLFGPYAIYHLLVQATDTLRYTIPLLPLLAVPAAVAVTHATRAPRLARVVAAAVLLGANVALSAPALATYAAQPGPAAQAIAYVTDAAGIDAPLVLGGHRIFDRYARDLPGTITRLDMPSREEWRVLNRYWLDGGRAPVWFLRDPTCTVLERIDPSAWSQVASWHWPDRLRRLMKGARPVDVELGRIDVPRWFVDGGFVLGIEGEPHQHVLSGPHVVQVRSDVGGRLVLSGHVADERVLTAVIDEVPVGRWTVSQGFAVVIPVPAEPGSARYRPVRLEGASPLHLDGVTLWPDEADVVAPERGFFREESDEQGVSFRWMGPEASLFVLRTGRPVVLTIRGRVTPWNFSEPPTTLRIVVNGTAVDERLPPGAFTLSVPLPAAVAGDRTSVELLTSSSFVPDDELGNGDRRTLALRLYELTVEPPER